MVNSRRRTVWTLSTPTTWSFQMSGTEHIDLNLWFVHAAYPVKARVTVDVDARGRLPGLGHDAGDAHAQRQPRDADLLRIEPVRRRESHAGPVAVKQVQRADLGLRGGRRAVDDRAHQLVPRSRRTDEARDLGQELELLQAPAGRSSATRCCLDPAWHRGTIPSVPDFAALAQPLIEARLEPGETFHGVAAATHQRTFSGQLYALGVTDRRLILQPVGRHIEAKGEPLLVTAETLESVKLDGAGDGWWTAPMAVLDATALTLELRIRGGDKLKLMLMKGGGGLMGSLGGGEAQQAGVVALAEWLRDHAPRR